MRARTILLAVVLGLLAAPHLRAAESEALFRDRVPSSAERALRAERSLDAPDEVVRSRPVSLNLAALPRAERPSPLPAQGLRVSLNLFDDVALHARITAVERRARGTAWTGHVEGKRLSSVVIVERDGVVAGNIVSLDAMYRIRWDGKGQVVEEVDRSRFMDDGCAAEVPPTSLAPDTRGSGLPGMEIDSGALVDVLVVYTPAARAAAGGTSGMLAEIDLAFTETNLGYGDSGVIQRLRLVGTAEVSYTETAASMSTDLVAVANPGDGVIDNVPVLRDTYKADLVSLIGSGYAPLPSGGTPCGIAYVGSNSASFAPYAYSVVNLPCMTGYFSFGHELGHNMGLNHDRATASCPTGGCGSGAYDYSFGYQDPAGAFRTVLAYNCPGGCSRVLHFSNPNVTEGGKTTGVSEAASNSAYNALSLNNTRSTVANWRVGGDAAPPFGTVDTPAAGASGLAGSFGVTGWALDDIEVTKVDIWRDPVGGEPTGANGKVYIGDATFVRGTRPDVEAAYPAYPNADRAGWGYMLLSHFLPGGGNGSVTLHAYGHDAVGNSTLLGSKTVSVDNASSVLPFGTIDTPGQGATVSGSSYRVWGWALTPMPAAVPTNGSTIWVYVDGAPVGNPVYNIYRSDIATLFPGYANASGAVGYLDLDTTTLSNGIHTISWGVTDDQGRSQGVGSRYFWVSN